MCNVLNDYLKTYNPDVTEFHSDSSDFEGTNSSLFIQNMVRHRRQLKTLYPNRKNRSMFQTTNIPTHPITENSSKETWGSVTTSISANRSTIDVQLKKTYKNKKYKILDGGDQIETIKSKRSVIRHKVIPCISSIFGRSNNNVKQMSIIKENPVENVNIDNGCQASRVNCEHKIRKFNRRQQYYAAQPVYAVDRNIHANSPPFQHTKIARVPLTNCKAVGNENCDNCSLTSSSEKVEAHKYSKRKKVNRNKPERNIIEPDIGKEYFECYDGRSLKHIEQQYPAKMSPVPLYNTFTGPAQCQQQNKNTSSQQSPLFPSLHDSRIELSSACSGFWEYIVNKINLKMQPQVKKIEKTTNTLPFKPCMCSGAQRKSSDSCCCHSSDPPPKPNLLVDCLTGRSRQIEPRCPAKRMKKKERKVECQCSLAKAAKCRPLRVREKTRPCQLNHDEVAVSLCNKYKGEILCIHNPPCVLINGCVKIPPPTPVPPPPPPPKVEPCAAMGLFSVTNDSKDNEFYYDEEQIKQLKKQQLNSWDRPSSYEKQNYQRLDASEKQQYPNVDAYSQCLIPPMEIKSKSKNTKNESCQYQIPQMSKNLMPSNYGIHYHISPLEVHKQQTTDDESHTEMLKHQATAIEGYKYWLSPNEISRQETATPESCQYRTSPTEIKKPSLTSDDSLAKIQQINGVKQSKKKRTKQEKNVQSICPHNPPCEVVRTCCKTKIEPKLPNSCVHVPMCENVPLCLMELKNRYQNISSCECPHKPKCTEVPVCTRNYIVLTAKEEVATQVRPKTKMMCRHEPPCIMIPTCLARVCDGCIPYDAIPDCIHQPMCEMIPACCRKSAKEMVSFRSQYPS